MKSFSSRCLLVLGALCPLALGSAGCVASTDPTGEVDGAERDSTTSALVPIAEEFSDAAYEDALSSALHQAQLASGVGGYAYAMFRGGQLVGSGRAGNTRPGVQWSPDTPFSMMSMGKTITAAALVRLLSERPDVSLDSPVIDYLPASWTPDPDFAPVTFRMLLSHESGLTTDVDTWASIETQVETNVRPPNSFAIKNGLRVPAGVGTPYYSNTNFTLVRVTLPYVMDQATADAKEQLGLGAWYTATTYRSRVVESLFHPLGVDYSTVDVLPIGTAPAGFYDDSGQQIWYVPNDGSSLLGAGAGYWTLSVKNYARFLDALFRGRYDVLSEGLRHRIWGQMSESGAADGNGGLGLYRTTGERGTYFTHNGGWSNGASGACARWMVYPNGLAAVWVMNSVVTNGSGDPTCPLSGSSSKMIAAYDDAWLPAVAQP
jgi:CubicO group peptidase (beta-lactamase class C family)